MLLCDEWTRETEEKLGVSLGSFDVVINDGKIRRRFTLNRPYQGLLVVPGIWRELDNFSSGSVCLVLASLRFDEADYMREYGEFLEWKNWTIRGGNNG